MEFPAFILPSKEGSDFGSNRYEAIPIRKQLESFLIEQGSATIDFHQIKKATQSWVDELLGRFILQEGVVFLQRVKFKNCTPVMQDIIKLVITDRVQQHESMGKAA